jgi:hypothetical protein
MELLRPVGRMLGFNRLRLESNRLIVSPLIGKPKRFVAVTDRLFREEDGQAATLAFISDDLEGPLVQIAAECPMASS